MAKIQVVVTATAASAVAVAFVIKHYWSSWGRLPYPPGPPGEFLIGHLRTFPKAYAWLTFTEWGRKYGPVNLVHVAGQPFLILNSQEAAVDLLEKRSSIYSDKQRYVMARELCGLMSPMGLVPYGSEHKRRRQVLAQALNPRAIQNDFFPVQERYSRQLAKALFDDPDDFINHIRRSFGDIVQTIAYGTSQEDGLDLVALGGQAQQIVGYSIANYWVDLFPWLTYVPDWFPGARFKRDAKVWRRTAEAAVRQPFDIVKKKKDAGHIQPNSFVLSLLGANDENGDILVGEDEIAAAAASLFAAGTGTSSATLTGFILAMILYPEVQARAQAELDRVVGDRLPTAADQGTLPYLDAVLKELIRWGTVIPTGGSRQLKQDDIYNGYFIPAGTNIVVNAWGILHDERHFPDPFTFDPDRWLSSSNGRLNAGNKDSDTAEPIDPYTVAFGYGRRFCPGMHVARNGLWIFMATLLSSFDIRRKVNPATKLPVELEARWTGGGLSAPLPFECTIEPRSPETAERIREAT